MRHQKRPSTSIEERTRHTRQRFRRLAAAAGRVACREYYPISVEFQCGDLRRGEETVVTLQDFGISRAFLGRRQDQAGLGAAPDLTRQHVMGGEMNGEVDGRPDFMTDKANDNGPPPCRDGTIQSDAD